MTSPVTCYLGKGIWQWSCGSLGISASAAHWHSSRSRRTAKGRAKRAPLSSLQQKMCAPLSGKCLWKSSEPRATEVNSNYQVLWAAPDSAGRQQASSEDSCGSVKRGGQTERDGHVRLRFGAAGDAGLCGSVAVRFNHNCLTTVVDHVHCTAAHRELRAGPVGDLRSPGRWWHGV